MVFSAAGFGGDLAVGEVNSEMFTLGAAATTEEHHAGWGTRNSCDVDLAASLKKANLEGADLSQSMISNTDLRKANLLGAKLPDYKKLSSPPKLDGATMPDGTIYQENN